MIGLDLEATVARTVGRLKERGPHAGQDVPVGRQTIEIAVRDTALEMRGDVLHIFRLAAVDITRQIEVEVVGHDLGAGHQAGVPWNVLESREGVHDLVDVLGTQPVFVAILHEPLAGVDHEDPLAPGGPFLVEHDDAGGDAGTVEQVGR